MTYAEKLKHPHWQKKRLEILERDNWTCRLCGGVDRTLHVHHKTYAYGKDPWDYDNDNFITFCEVCHALVETFKDLNLRAVKVFDFEDDDIVQVVGMEYDGSVHGFEYHKNTRSCIYTAGSSPEYLDVLMFYYLMFKLTTDYEFRLIDAKIKGL